MKKMIIFIMICLLSTISTYAWEFEEVNISGTKTFIYTLTISEQPINDSVFIGQYSPKVEIINNSYFDNVTNTSIENLTQILIPRNLTFSRTSIISVPTYLYVNETKDLYVNVSIDNFDTNIYNGFIDIYDENDGGIMIDTAEFKFVVNFDDDIFEDEGSYIMQPENNVYNRWVYESDLPKIFSEMHRIRTRPNEILDIRCVAQDPDFQFECSNTRLSTQNISLFTSTTTLPKNTPIGKHFGMIYLNTSYNTSGNISVVTEVLETKVIIQNKTITIETEPENMTAAELREFLEMLDETTERRIQELDAANRTKEKTVYVNKTIPYLANKDEIALAVATYYQGRDSESYLKLSEMVDEMGKTQTNLMNQLKLTELELNSTKAQIIDEDEVRHMAILQFNETIKKTNIIMEKGKLFKYVIILILFIGLPILFIVAYQRAWGGAL